MRPIIGVTSYYVKAYEIEKDRPRGVKGQDMQMATMDYLTSVERAGGLPVAIPVIRSPDYIENIAEKIDGLILSGGPDVYPLLYEEKINRKISRIITERDRFEMELLDIVLNKGKPIFGICKGMHIINIYFKGTLYQDIYDEMNTAISHSGNKLSPSEPCHYVRFEKDTLLNNLCGGKIPVNSFHHQAIKDLGQGLVPIGWSCEDNIIEAVVHRKIKNIFGVQWHPEMMTETDRIQFDIFKHFMKLIKEGEEN